MPNVISIFLAVSVLAVAVPALAVDPVCGDVNKNGSLTSSDALAVLKASVGQPVTLQCPPLSAPLKTSQTNCYNTAGSEITCNGTGHDGDLQKGISHSFTDNGDGTITDNRTGLVWEKLSNDGSIHDWDNTYTWANAFAGKVASLNSGNFAGHNDWRVPNFAELHTLLDASVTQPAVQPIFDTNCPNACTVLTCSCTQSDWYWTSTSYELDTTWGWFVDFYNGYTDSTDKTEVNYVRAVRGGS